MNKCLSTFFTCVLFMMCFDISHAKNQSLNHNAFNKAAFENMKQQKLGERWLIVLWSLDCPACFKELKLMQTLQLEHKSKRLNVVFINTDDSDEVTFDRQQVLSSYGMLNFSNFYFSDGQGDQSRYQIDPQWYGELPRSYFVDEQGMFYGKSGLLDETLIKKWLVEK